MAHTPITAVGRRKTATASVVLLPAEKNSLLVNGMDPKSFFKTAERAHVALDPFTIAEAAGHYMVRAHVEGGGVAAQAGAVRHALSRALIQVEPQTRPVLKAANFLTRDPRAKERKKPGLVKARKRKQWSKR